MEILPIRTPILRQGDDIASVLRTHCTLRKDDIVVISSKALATVEGATLDLDTLVPSAEATMWAERMSEFDIHFVEAILQETSRLDGSIVGACPGALLTELRPPELSRGTILIANAGLDRSNSDGHTAVGWPRNAVESTRALREHLADGSPLGVILSDSCCQPRRRGVTAVALVVSGFDPLASQEGLTDLFGRPLRITTEAIADQLATAANAVMGNAAQSVPAAIIRDHGLPLNDWDGWVPGIEPDEDLFKGILPVR